MIKRLKYLLGFPCVVKTKSGYYVVKKPLFGTQWFLSRDAVPQFNGPSLAKCCASKEEALELLDTYHKRNGVLV